MPGDGQASGLPAGSGAEPAHPPALLEERPDGRTAHAIDTATTDPATLDDAELVDAIVVFERLSSWAGARQARLLAEFARRRPTHDPHTPTPDDTEQPSRYAADEIGLALRLTPCPHRPARS